MQLFYQWVEDIKIFLVRFKLTIYCVCVCVCVCVCMYVCVYSFGIRSVIPSLYLFHILHVSTWTDSKYDYNFNFLSLFQKSAYRLCHIKRCLSRLLIIHFCGSVEHVGNRFLIGGTTFTVTLHRGHCARIVQLRTVVLIRYEITSVGNTETCFSSLWINVCVCVCVSCHSVTSFNTITDTEVCFLHIFVCVCVFGGRGGGGGRKWKIKKKLVGTIFFQAVSY